MEKRKPGIEKAMAFIKNGIDTQQFRGRLPSIQLLANEARVSFVTMWKAVNQLKKLKVIEDGHVNMIYHDKTRGLKEHRPETAETQLDDATGDVFWQQLKNRLKKDILSGRYPHDQPLPSCKELMYHHGVSFRTLKKALDTLVSEGMIKPFKRGYTVPMITISEAHARVVAIGCGWKDGKIWADYQDKNYFRILESECIQSKIALDVIVYYRQNDKLSFIHSATRKPYDLGNDNILGIIYIVANLEVNPGDILKELSLLKKPVAVLDVVGYFQDILNVSPGFSGNRFLQFFTTTASAFPAKMVARYLLSLRHTAVAFISPFHRAPWSKIRHASCASVYRDAGYPGGITPFVLDHYAYQWDYLRDAESHEDLQSLLGEYSQWKEYAHSNFFRKFGNISYSISKYLTEWNCASGEIYKKMRSLCEKALRDKTITAWLMANDFAATLAFDYLKEKNIRVPEDISLIAFDNTLDAMEYQLTSYDFNNNGIVTMMLRYVLTPSTIPVSQRGKFVDVEGTIVVRRSTAPAARKV
jgi:DNA-binding transcriptional regulator YhcF (GntR family)/DNA-binding LacI/PurR family transcriptional regulator